MVEERRPADVYVDVSHRAGSSYRAPEGAFRKGFVKARPWRRSYRVSERKVIDHALGDKELRYSGRKLVGAVEQAIEERLRQRIRRWLV